mgnify:CR=1 FL=1
MTFRDYIQKHRRPEELNKILLSIANGVEEIHLMGYVHRDLKPENVVMNLEPLEVRVIDFERARLDSQSSKGTALGTPGYMPEV